MFIDVGECEHVTRKTFGNLWKSTIKGYIYIYIAKDVLQGKREVTLFRFSVR